MNFDAALAFLELGGDVAAGPGKPVEDRGELVRRDEQPDDGFNFVAFANLGQCDAKDTVGERHVGDVVDKNLIQKPRLLSLERQSAEIEGSLAANHASIARARQRIGESRLRISELDTAQINEAVEKIGEVQSELLDLAERIRAAEDVRARIEIRSPQDGIVVGLAAHTSGGVIAPGERLMDIVPSGDRLIVEAKVDPQDIDIVHDGLPARVRFTSFGQRNLVPIEGRVQSISADHISDERTGASYYLARIELTEDPGPALDGGVLYPGMPAEVMIVTGSRTALEYFLEPLTRTLERSMREN